MNWLKNKSKSLIFRVSFVVAFCCLFLAIIFLPNHKKANAVPSCSTLGSSANSGVNCIYPSCASLGSSAVAGVNCLPNCADLTSANSINGIDSPTPGVNCYYLNLPLCTPTAQSVSVNHDGSTPQPRVNCADLIDLPLCSQIEPSSNIKNLRNCVSECSQTVDILDTSTTGHNRTCVRFCDRLPASMTANPRNESSTISAGNCVNRQCHKLDDQVIPTNSNCAKIACNKLLPDELDESRIQNSDDPSFAEYCDGSNIKCYEFSEAQIPFVRFRSENSMCKIHSCRPDSESCGRGVVGLDDTLNITNKGANFTSLYETYINIGTSIEGKAICSPVICRPTIYTPYICSADTSNNLTIRNTECDSSGDGSICATSACTENAECRKDLGYCYKTIDCNVAANNSLAECVASSGSSNETYSTEFEDDTNSWFYRPKPKNKAFNDNNPNNGYRTNGYCYSKGDLQKQPDNSGTDGCTNGSRWGCEVRYDLGLFTVNLGYFHMQWGPDDITRSPKMCNVVNNGWRGLGYIYLCGNKGNLYKPIDNSASYYKGYIKSTFVGDKDVVSKVNVCLRFKNAIRMEDYTMTDSETCGSRECAISCAFGKCEGQICGYDVCKELTVKYSDSKECAMNNEMFLNPGENRPCAEVIDSFLRLRAVQYGHKICTFVDVKGQLAYNKMFFNGNEKLDNGRTCISGVYNPDNQRCSGGKDTNDDEGFADRWRTILKVRYTEGNVTDENGDSGFYNKEGLFIKAQECAQIPLKTSPPDLYNLANPDNTIKLFAPPILIRNVYTKKGGSRSVDADNPALFGPTDFLEPEIEVQFGTSTRRLAMGIGFSGYEVEKDPASYALDSTALTTSLNGSQYSANLLIKKDIEANGNLPKLCLYQRLDGSSGFLDIKLDCVDRNLPEINNSGKDNESVLGVRKIQVSPTANTAIANNLDLEGKYLQPGLIFKYCNDSSCSNSNSLTFTNINADQPLCLGQSDNNLERYKICAAREVCSKLWRECMENEIKIQNEGLTFDRNSVRAQCQNLVTQCNQKKGITSQSANLIDSVSATNSDINAYGWFNEICIISGFETKLKQVYQAITSTGTTGKCKLDSSSPATCHTSQNTAENWRNGTCKCLEFSDSTTFAGYSITSRAETAREAGLCVDIPIPKICPAINYEGDTFNNSSINGTAYTDSEGIVDIKHRDRKNSIIPSASINGGRAEYMVAVVGMNNVVGVCNGFWKTTSSNGALISPMMNCIDDSSSTTTAKWSGLLTSSNSASCERYSCPAISTGNANNESNEFGNYASDNFTILSENYDQINETLPSAGQSLGITYNAVTLSTKGASNGFAVWNSYTKNIDSDFLENIAASSCIVGYQASNLPTRDCNQLGNWRSVNSSCVRKTCPAILPPVNPVNSSDWAAWNDSKGATFGVEVYYQNPPPDGKFLGEPISGGIVNSTPASRSTTSITPGSIRKGYCNNRLGFFQVLGGHQPERDCDHNGNWGSVRNPCVTTCNAVSTANQANGFATWGEVINVAIGGSVEVNGTCATGYQNYPYTPFRNSEGSLISPTPAINGSGESTPPKRVCKSVTVAGGTANVWSNTSSECVNTCPGYQIDSREGVGKTTYQTLTFGQIEIRWDNAQAGQTQIKTVGFKSSGSQVGESSIINHNAADYSNSNRNNGKFIVSRVCNANLKWSDPIISCASNAGLVNNAVIGSALGSTPTQSNILSSFINQNSDRQAASCSTNYAASPLPTFRCQSNPANSNIDQYFLNKVAGNDCNQVTCNLVNGQNYGSGSIYNGSTTSVPVGSVVSLSCRSNFGHAINDDDAVDTTYNENCGRRSYDRSQNAPTARCDTPTDGSANGVLTISNDCSACRSCNNSISRNIFGDNVTISESMSCNNDSRDIQTILSACINSGIAFNISHNSTQVFGHTKQRKCVVSSKCRERNICNAARLKCLDGRLQFDSSAGYNLGSTNFCQGSDPSVINCSTSSQSCND